MRLNTSRMCERKSNLEPHPPAPPSAARGPGTGAAEDAISLILVLFFLLPRLDRLRSSSPPDVVDAVRSLSESRNRLPAWKDRVMRGGLSRDMEPRAMGEAGDGDGVVHDGRGDSFPSSNAAGNDDDDVDDDEPALSALTNAGGGGDPRVPPVAGDGVGDSSNDDDASSSSSSFFSNRKGGNRRTEEYATEET